MSNLVLICIFLDFMKAFDSVPRQRLVLKLKAYGLHDSLLKINCFCSFLIDRRQRVITNSHSSDWSPCSILSGVPKDFGIYINDLQ